MLKKESQRLFINKLCKSLYGFTSKAEEMRDCICALHLTRVPVENFDLLAFNRILETPRGQVVAIVLLLIIKS